MIQREPDGFSLTFAGRGGTYDFKRDGDASLADHSYTVAAVNAIGAEGEQSAPVQVTYTPPPAVS